MAIGKPRGSKGIIPVYIKVAGKQMYVKPADFGMDPPTTERAAHRLEGLAYDRLRKEGARPKSWTVSAWRDEWLEKHHGPNTPRPEPTTRMHNDQGTRLFVSGYGPRALDELSRSEAHDFALQHPHQAKVVAAMYATAVDKEIIQVSPFSRLGVSRGRGRADIDPLTLGEVYRLSEVAREQLGLYGPEFSVFLLFLGRVGCRPGEACGLEWQDVDVSRGVADIRRSRRNDGSNGPVKKRERRTVIVPRDVCDALRTLPRREGGIFRTATGKPLLPNSYRYYWKQVRAAFCAELPASHWLPRRLADGKSHLDVYELRHAVGSWLASKGYSAREIAVQLGNTPAVCEEVYLHDYRGEVLERLRRGFDEPTPLREIRGASHG